MKVVTDRLNGEIEDRVRLEVLRWKDAHARARAIVRRLDAEAKVTPAQKCWAAALEQWLASKPT